MSGRTSQYRQAILLFGFVLPGFLAAAIIGALVYAKSELHTTMANKKRLYAAHERGRQEILTLEKKLIKQRPLAKLWAGLLEEETSRSFTAKISELREKLPEAEFQQTSFNPSTTRGAFGSTSPQPSRELQVSFRASYRAMQRAFLEIESSLPQLQLQSLKIERAPSEPTLSFQASYTAWTK